MTTQSEHPMADQQYGQPQQYGTQQYETQQDEAQLDEAQQYDPHRSGQPQQLDPRQQFDETQQVDQQGYVQPARAQHATADAGADPAMGTEHLTGAPDGGAANTQQVADARPPRPAADEDVASTHTPLFAEDERDSINDRWKQIQSAFVDEPRQAVQQADELVAELMQQLARMFADERGKLESQWAQGTDVSTEDLRQGLQRYREFFQRLLAA